MCLQLSDSSLVDLPAWKEILDVALKTEGWWMLLSLLIWLFQFFLTEVGLVFNFTCIVLLVFFWRRKVLWANRSALRVITDCQFLITDTFLSSPFPSSTKVLIKNEQLLSCWGGRWYFWSETAHQLNTFELCSMKQVPLCNFLFFLAENNITKELLNNIVTEYHCMHHENTGSGNSLILKYSYYVFLQFFINTLLGKFM